MSGVSHRHEAVTEPPRLPTRPRSRATAPARPQEPRPGSDPCHVQKLRVRFDCDRFGDLDLAVEAGRVVEGLRLVESLPGEVAVIAAEVAIRSGLAEDRPTQIEVA